MRMLIVLHPGPDSLCDTLTPLKFQSLSRSSRRFSKIKSSEVQETKNLSAGVLYHAGDDQSPEPSTTEEPNQSDQLPNLRVKRVDHYFSIWSNLWKYRNTVTGVVAEGARPSGNSGNDPWHSYCFVVVRKIPSPQERESGAEIMFKIVVKSQYLLEGLKAVVGKVLGISWTAEPLELDPHVLLAFFPQLEQYKHKLCTQSCTSKEDYVLSSVSVLLEYLRTDYRTTLAQIANLTANAEITFDLLYAIFPPRTIVITECPATGAPHALKVLSLSKSSSKSYTLLCESVDSTDVGLYPGRHNRSSQNYLHSGSERDRQWKSYSSTQTADGPTSSFGRLETRITLTSFKGMVDIATLEAYPIDYHPNAPSLKATLIARGRKWASLVGIHHLQYEGIAARPDDGAHGKYSVNSRVMIDRGNYVKFNPKNRVPVASEMEMGSGTQQPDFVPLYKVSVKPRDKDSFLTDEQLLLATPILYGFSLSDKLWLRFNVEHFKPIEWNEEAFEGLVLDSEKKNLLQSLVKAHIANVGFDDLIQGKGQGLVINLFGPPGVGKTLSAEATSEHVHRPLYVVGGGDLGGYASKVDAALDRVFDIATSWNAIVLIDEADVFMERRSINDLDRNAMVAVFLRHIEYYRGILFLTTNRVKAFDEAFLSRIHVGLYFGELSESAKAQVWRTFLRKAGVSEPDIGDDLAQQLAARKINGRQIKNACRTAQSSAFSRGESLGFGHLTETLDAMGEFAERFAAMAQE